MRLDSRPIRGAVAQPHDVLPALSATGGVLLTGQWAGGGAIVADHPLVVVSSAERPFEVFETRTEDISGAGAVGGGWFGWFGFGAGRDGIAGPDDPPVSSWALHPNVLRFDAASGRWFDEALFGLIPDARLERRRARLVELVTKPRRPARSFGWGEVAAAPTRQRYLDAVGACIEHIKAGDIYQANICLRLSADFRGDPAAAHERLLALQPAYGAYLATSAVTVSSASPELFLRRRGREVLSAPIKGTRPRPADEQAAALEAAVLCGSDKERAENVMIVDLIRNDLSRVAETGSVTVPALLRLEPHPGVWHLVSDVAARVAPGTSDAQLLRATYPPGSVTGAPKLRALEIIAELEAASRGIYTGAIGYVSPVAGLELSVAIRTIEIAAGRAELGVGAGITAGSDPQQEWLECLTKARPLLAAVGAPPPG